MQLSFTDKGKKYSFDTSQPIDISIPIRAGNNNPNAFYASDPRITPMKAGSFIGDVLQGGSCNVNELYLNVHCSGTHTECVGHISKEKDSLNRCLKEFFFLANVISIAPEERNGDKIITKQQIERAFEGVDIKRNALIVRTLPNDDGKQTKDYSGTNPAYLHHEAAAWLCENGIDHLLLDLPSVDREDDNKLLAHHAYWQYPQQARTHATITELIYVPETVPDGFYLLNLQITSLENDASPGKPVLYKLL